jgi:periplasmic copper chaperone A
MKIFFGTCLLSAMVLGSPGLALAGIDLTVDHGAVWQTAKTGETTQGFLKIHNAGDSADVLTGWTCSIASATSLVGRDGKALTTLTIPPGQTVTLTPTGLHLMLQQTRDAVVFGSVVPCDFTFQNAGDVAVYLNAVTAPGQHG